jgi:hypothetical protein
MADIFDDFMRVQQSELWVPRIQLEQVNDDINPALTNPNASLHQINQPTGNE